VIRLLGRKTSGNVQKVVWLLEELGIDYTREDYGRQFNNTGGDYLTLNPNGKVPTLVDGDTTIWESNSVLRYLARRNGNRFYAADPAQQSRIERWMDWQLGTLDPGYLPIFREAKTVPDQRSAQFGANVKALGDVLSIVERGLADHPWIAGKEMTIADISIGPVIDRCMKFEIALPALPALRHWHGEVAKRPGFVKAIA
jgi:glutathione S-transferase